MQGIFQKENTDKALKYGIYRHLPTYEKIIRNLVSFSVKSNELTRQLRQAKLDKEKLMAAEGDATAQRTRELIALLEDGPDFLDRPDTELCGALVAEIIVESNDTLRFRLHNGLELRESIERTVR